METSMEIILILLSNVWKPLFAQSLAAILDFSKFVQAMVSHDAILV
jgi:hypothetical protein